MSAAPEAPRRIAELCDEAVGELVSAQAILDQLRVKVQDVWLCSQLDQLDTHVHNALTRLGD
jgi:hypothetical protein